MTARRKPQPRNAPAVDLVAALLLELIDLQRVAVNHLAAIRAKMMEEETAQAPAAAISNNGDAPTSSLINPDDLLTVQRAAGIAGHVEKTIRDWHRVFGIGIVLGGTLFIQKSKLLAHLAHKRAAAGSKQRP